METENPLSMKNKGRIGFRIEVRVRLQENVWVTVIIFEPLRIFCWINKKMGDLTWSSLLTEQCPYLKKLITKDDGEIDAQKLHQTMEKLNLDPCTMDDQKECLERNCSILWRYYIQRKHDRNRSWKKCGNAITDLKHINNAECSEAESIANHLFQESQALTYRPGDLLFLYDLVKQENQTEGTSLHKISKKRGDAILKVNYKATPDSIHGNNIIRFLSVNHPHLLDYFVRIYALEMGTNHFQPTRKKTDTTNMYILLESMDGSMKKFCDHFQSRDPQFWNRMTRMCIHAFTGLYELYKLGFSFNHVSCENLMFKLDFEHTLTALKWMNFDAVAEIGKNVDTFEFGMMIFEILFGSMDRIDKNWRKNYQTDNQAIHNAILKLMADELMKPISTVAYHFVVNSDLFPSEKRWTFEEAFHYLSKHPLKKDVLKPLPDW